MKNYFSHVNTTIYFETYKIKNREVSEVSEKHTYLVGYTVVM